MSKKKKKTSGRPKGFVGKRRPIGIHKRLIVALVGCGGLLLCLWGLLSWRTASIPWYGILILVLIFSYSFYLIIIALLRRERQVQENYSEIQEAGLRAAFRGLLKSIF
jgi:hypothetical protein